jgi:hypothetical protein
MPVPSAITDLSQTASSNYPTGAESPITADDYFRAHAAFIAALRDGKGFTDMVQLASGITTDIGGQNSMAVEITGTTTITSFGTTYNGPRFLRFTGALTLTHNATTLYLPGAVNIKTVAGDTCIAIPNSSANGWVIVSYQRTPSRGSVTMHATTMDLWAEPNIIDGTGSSVTITDIADAPQAGAVRTLYPVTGTVITDGATFDVDGGGNYTTEAGDALIFEAVTTSTFKVHIVKADGTAVVSSTPSGTLAQWQYSQSGTTATGTTIIPFDSSIPQNTEGDQYLSVSITPQNASSSLEIEAQLIISTSAGNGYALIMALFKDSNADALSASFEYTEVTGGGYPRILQIKHKLTAGSTSAMTFKIRAGCNTAGTTTVNGGMGGVSNSYISVKEYLP